jgi:hypothetical protein
MPDPMGCSRAERRGASTAGLIGHRIHDGEAALQTVEYHATELRHAWSVGVLTDPVSGLRAASLRV